MLHFLYQGTGVANFSILERVEIKGWQNDECLSMCMYIINKIPHGKCFVCYLCARCLCMRNSLVCCAHSFNLCVNTVWAHFPRSILYCIWCELLIFLLIITFLYLPQFKKVPNSQQQIKHLNCFTLVSGNVPPLQEIGNHRQNPSCMV